MNKKNRCFIILLFIFILSIGCVVINTKKTFENKVKVISYLDSTNVDLLVGTFTSKDGKTIIVKDDGTILYNNTYELTLNKYDNGNILSGTIGTSFSVNFYQVNETTIISDVSKDLNNTATTVGLEDYTVFKMNSSPTEATDGVIEVLDGNNNLVGKYNDLQSAVDATANGYIIKLTNNIKINNGCYISGKEITLDGNNYIIDNSSNANSLLIVAEDATLNIKDLTIDGGATGFEVDYDAVTFTNYTIPLKNGSSDNDPKLNISPIISKGNLNINNSTMTNIYTNSFGGVISVARGNLNINNSLFEHNYSIKYGGVIYAGIFLKNTDTDYPVDTLNIDGSTFKNNYAGFGGALYTLNTKAMNINNSTFDGNAANGGKGGAICFSTERPSDVENVITENLNLDFGQATVTDSIFNNNWVGNDGSAIQSYEADLYISGTEFTKNVGIHPTSSVGTVSVESFRKKSRIYLKVDDCVFKENNAPVPGIGDHDSLMDLDVINTTFEKNKGNEIILLYSSVANFENVNFIDENVLYGVVDARRYANHDVANSLTLKNVNFDGTRGPTDVLVRKQGRNAELNSFEVNVYGNTKANIDVWDNNYLNIYGNNYSGTIINDGITEINRIYIEDKDSFKGTIIDKYGTYTVMARYPEEDDDSIRAEFYYLEKDRTYTKAELYPFELVKKDGYTLKYYTDNTYENIWDYTPISHMTVYAKWEEHNHIFDRYIALNGSIYEQCECGFTGKELTINPPSDLTYNSEKKEVIVINNLNIKDSDYKITYYKLVNNEWTSLDSSPIEIGTYKAVLSYNNMEIETEYEISDIPDNPDTGYLISFLILGILISTIGGFGYYFIKHKKPLIEI